MGRRVDSRVLQKEPGDPGFVQPVRLPGGEAKVMLPEMLVGMLLEMGAGSASTPKGGLKELLDAYAEGDLQNALRYRREDWNRSLCMRGSE